jgi:hypothetical protein
VTLCLPGCTSLAGNTSVCVLGFGPRRHLALRRHICSDWSWAACNDRVVLGLDITGAFYSAWVFISLRLALYPRFYNTWLSIRASTTLGYTSAPARYWIYNIIRTALGSTPSLGRHLVLRQRCAAPRLALHVRLCCAWF